MFIPDSTDIDLMIKGGQLIMDEIVSVMDEVTLCYPPRWFSGCFQGLICVVIKYLSFM